MLKLLASCSSKTVIPKGDAVPVVAAILEEFRDRHGQWFWNVPKRKRCENDAIFIGISVSAMKQQGTLAAVHLVPVIASSLAVSREEGEMLSEYQERILAILAPLRNERSYVAGSTPLNISLERLSSDIDIFCDTAEICQTSFLHDAAAFAKAGMIPTITRNSGSFLEAHVKEGNASTVIQWLNDSPWRFFPAREDPIFGFRLDERDLVVNKILALASREAVRDYYDICRLIIDNEPVGAYVFAACGKDPGYTPESLLSAISFAARLWREEDLANIDGGKLGITECREAMNGMIRKTLETFPHIPAKHAGAMFLLEPDGKPVLPGQNDQEYIIHHARPGGSEPELKPGASPVP